MRNGFPKEQVGVNAFGAGSWMHHWWRYCNIRRGLTNALSRVLILGVLKFAGGLALFAQIPIAQMYHKSWTFRVPTAFCG